MVDFREQSDLSIALKDLELLEVHSQRHQTISIYRHKSLGRVLIINGEVQHVEAWQALYHEPLVHVPAAFVPEVCEALVLGGGSLFAAREVLRYPTLRSCVLVDHDPHVIAAMSRHYPHARRVLEDVRFEYITADVSQFLHSCDRQFDLVINDWVDITSAIDAKGYPIEPMTKLLTPDGVCADVMYRHVFDEAHVQTTRAALRPFGPTAHSLITVPEYPGVLHLLSIWGSKYVSQLAREPRNVTQIGWMTAGTPVGFEFYDSRYLSFYLYLPPYVQRRLTESHNKVPSKSEFDGGTT